jgi:V/A-type H+-transporting ATPase subunit I
MKRLTLVGLTEEKADVMEALMRLGAVEMDAGGQLPSAEDPASFDDRNFLSLNALSRLETVAEFCRHHHEMDHRLGSAKRTVSQEDFLLAGYREQEIMAQLNAFEHIDATITELKARMAQDRQIQEMLTPWRGLQFDLALTATGQTVLFAGVFPTQESLAAFDAERAAGFPETHIEIISEDETSIRAVVATLRQREGLVHGSLRQNGFHLLPTGGLSGTPEEILARIESQADDHERRLARLEQDLADRVSNGRDFELLHDFYLLRSDKIEALRELPGTASTFYLTGWAPAAICTELTGALKQRFLVAIESREPEEGEEPPVLFNNHPLVKPYEVIVEMFSPPSAADVDPSPLLAPFFFFFFGMMLSDVGYGLVLAGVTGYLTFKKKKGGQMVRMLFLSGIASVIWGFLFGGFFGDMLTVLSEGRIALPSMWFNPMNEPMTLMAWSMIFGVLHLFTAMGAKIYLLAKAGHLMDGLLDIAPWFLVIIGLGLMIGGDMILPGGPLGMAGQVMAMAGAAVLLLFGGRDAKNPIMRLVKGLLSLYNITGYFSDILSYTRILALVLATSVIAMVVNLLGFLMGPSPLGYLMFAVVALLGHSLNLALSALSAYVHTSRLHYVEFFSKFYEGGGKLFRPLQTRTRFVQLEERRKASS